MPPQLSAAVIAFWGDRLRGNQNSVIDSKRRRLKCLRPVRAGGHAKAAIRRPPRMTPATMKPVDYPEQTGWRHEKHKPISARGNKARHRQGRAPQRQDRPKTTKKVRPRVRHRALFPRRAAAAVAWNWHIRVRSSRRGRRPQDWSPAPRTHSTAIVSPAGL